MRKLFFLLPGTTQKYRGGGLGAELRTLELAQQVCEAVVVTYQQREKDTLFIDDVLAERDRAIFVVSWGFDVPKLLRRLRQHNVVYHAHSTGYGFSVPASVPIITVSRNTMGYWGQQALGSLIYYLPNEISVDFCDRGLPRDIDVLVQARKSSEYLLTQLVPELRSRCQITLIDSYVEDLAGLFNRAKVYLYDSAEYWGRFGLTEGFGLPPMEALACGCQVFSSVNHALADYLDPGFNCHKIAGYANGYDAQRILQVVQNWQPNNLSEDFFASYQPAQLVPRLRVILTELNDFFDHRPKYTADIPNLTAGRVLYLTAKRIGDKLRSTRQ